MFHRATCERLRSATRARRSHRVALGLLMDPEHPKDARNQDRDRKAHRQAAKRQPGGQRHLLIERVGSRRIAMREEQPRGLDGTPQIARHHLNAAPASAFRVDVVRHDSVALPPAVSRPFDTCLIIGGQDDANVRRADSHRGIEIRFGVPHQYDHLRWQWESRRFRMMLDILPIPFVARKISAQPLVLMPRRGSGRPAASSPRPSPRSTCGRPSASTSGGSRPRRLLELVRDGLHLRVGRPVLEH